MDERSIFDVSPEMFGASEQLLQRFFLTGAVLITFLAAAAFAGR